MGGHEEPEIINSAVIVCKAPLVKELSSSQIRLPPNYIGVRRVRPSSRAVATQLLADSNPNGSSASDVVFKIKDEDGNERRMNRKEKKALKQKMAAEKKIAKKRRLTNQSSSESLTTHSANEVPQETLHRYHQLSVNAAALEQELAELRGDRSGLPPVLLSPPMALQARSLLGGATPAVAPLETSTRWICYDPALSEEWAKSLKERMLPAETVRQAEDMRPMAYKLTPEVWSRLRPTTNQSKLQTQLRHSSFQAENELTPSVTLDTVGAPRDWNVMSCRPPSDIDLDVAVVFEYLHRETTFHVSCGAKFGSDLLLYDGPREDRHAFAGLRVLSGKDDLPFPSAYSLAGYVRCLNTAGKLALLATIVHDQPNVNEHWYKIALVDVALEKILTVPTHKRHGKTQVRRDVTLNLAKK